jgi:hypothetical protein
MRKIAYALTGLTAAVGLALGMSLPASAAPAASTAVTGTTYLPANADSGNGPGNSGTWAIDTFHRVLTVSQSGACTNDVPEDYTCYSAAITDLGTFRTAPGNGDAPNPASATDPGTNMAFPSVSGPFSGSATYLFEANTTPAVADIADVVNNHGNPDPAGDDSTPLWFEQAFGGGTTFLNSDGTTFSSAISNNWGWSYTTMTGGGKHTSAVSCESWTDSFANGAGALAADGNITGTQCAGALKPHYVRVPDCLGKRVYICAGLLGGKGLRYVVEHNRKPRTAYFVKGTSPDPRAVVLKGSVVHLNDVHKL